VDVAVIDEEEMSIFWSKDHRELATEHDAHNVPRLRLVGCKAEIAERGLDESLVVGRVLNKYGRTKASPPFFTSGRIWSGNRSATCDTMVINYLGVDAEGVL
jgi:hypothetical protein